MDEWLVENLVEYKTIFEDNNDNEKAINGCVRSMVKILNGLSEMSYTQFLRYEKRMLWNPMRLFSEQCIKQLKYAISCNHVAEKKKVITDIEQSICNILDVYRNILDGTANIERQMFQSLSVDANVYGLSPKLCAFYSMILKNLVSLFEETKKYAFIIHPSLKSTIETNILLKERKEAGKVVIVYVSENVMEDFSFVSVCLFHEVFHVITNRHRKKRAKCFMIHMIQHMEKFLFEGTELFQDGQDIKKEEKIRAKLMEHWFRAGSYLNELLSYHGADKLFYGDNIKEYIVDIMKTCLTEINNDLETAIKNAVFDEEVSKDYQTFQKKFDKIIQLKEKIEKNIYKIFYDNKAGRIADALMFIYRETYADIACILTLELTSDQYKNAFSKSIQFHYDHQKYHDDNKGLREWLVAKTVIEFLPPNKRDSWKNYIEKLEVDKLKREKENNESTSNANQQAKNDSNKNDNSFTISLTDQTLLLFENYLTHCAETFSERLNKIGNMKVFREKMDHVLEGTHKTLLMEILSGDDTILNID